MLDGKSNGCSQWFLSPGSVGETNCSQGRLLVVLTRWRSTQATRTFARCYVTSHRHEEWVKKRHLKTTQLPPSFPGTSKIGHFGKYHNTLCLFPQILDKHCFQFLLGLTMVPRENKNNAHSKFGVTNNKYSGIFQSGLIGNLIFDTKFPANFFQYSQKKVFY